MVRLRVERGHVRRDAAVAVVRVGQRQLGRRMARLCRALSHQVVVAKARVHVASRRQTTGFVSRHHNVASSSPDGPGEMEEASSRASPLGLSACGLLELLPTCIEAQDLKKLSII